MRRDVSVRDPFFVWLFLPLLLLWLLLLVLQAPVGCGGMATVGVYNGNVGRDISMWWLGGASPSPLTATVSYVENTTAASMSVHPSSSVASSISPRAKYPPTAPTTDSKEKITADLDAST